MTVNAKLPFPPSLTLLSNTKKPYKYGKFMHDNEYHLLATGFPEVDNWQAGKIELVEEFPNIIVQSLRYTYKVILLVNKGEILVIDFSYEKNTRLIVWSDLLSRVLYQHSGIIQDQIEYILSKEAEKFDGEMKLLLPVDPWAGIFETVYLNTSEFAGFTTVRFDTLYGHRPVDFDMVIPNGQLNLRMLVVGFKEKFHSTLDEAPDDSGFKWLYPDKEAELAAFTDKNLSAFGANWYKVRYGVTPEVFRLLPHSPYAM